MSKLGAFDQSPLGAFIESTLSARGFEAAGEIFASHINRQRYFAAGACAGGAIGWSFTCTIYLHGDRRSDLTYLPGTYHYGELWTASAKVAPLLVNTAIGGIAYRACPTYCSTDVLGLGAVDTPDGYTQCFIGASGGAATPDPFLYWDKGTVFKVIHRITGAVLNAWQLPPDNTTNKIFCPLAPATQYYQTDLNQAP